MSALAGFVLLGAFTCMIRAALRARSDRPTPLADVGAVAFSLAVCVSHILRHHLFEAAMWVLISGVWWNLAVRHAMRDKASG